MLGESISLTPAFQDHELLAASRSWSDHQRYGDFNVGLTWDARLAVQGPRTLTQDEATQLVARFADVSLRSKCAGIVLNMPDELLPLVYPQLEEMVEYEWSMLLERQANRRPAIRESWTSLPSPR